MRANLREITAVLADALQEQGDIRQEANEELIKLLAHTQIAVPWVSCSTGLLQRIDLHGAVLSRCGYNLDRWSWSAFAGAIAEGEGVDVIDMLQGAERHLASLGYIILNPTERAWLPWRYALSQIGAPGEELPMRVPGHFERPIGTVWFQDGWFKWAVHPNGKRNAASNPQGEESSLAEAKAQAETVLRGRGWKPSSTR